ncbi:hypothetical protein JKP88DRAFT_160615 [Tribonema minus]|uniref:Mediator of RNA polymerase II transcription subunit 20 n=1 Tax=Tribonema minus TaxID=303371 RepID=A0A835Z8G4_9STRA|nr:hypothetical protein JKP88DRAFT_160615 [Tribonema minus]
MRFGVNTAVAFIGEGARQQDATYPFDRINVVRRSDEPGRVCLVQEMGKRAATLEQVLVGDDALEADMAKKVPYPTRLKAVIEGSAFSLGDFTVRVGTCRKGSTYRGLAMEVEYHPCSSVRDGEAMIEALLPTLDPAGTFRHALSPLPCALEPMAIGNGAGASGCNGGSGATQAARNSRSAVGALQVCALFNTLLV